MPFSVTHTFSAGTKAKAGEVNTNFDDIVDALNSSALADGGTPGDLIICDASGNPIQQGVTGAISIDEDGLTTLGVEVGSDGAAVPANGTYANVVAITLSVGWWVVWGSVLIDAQFSDGADFGAKLLQDLTTKDTKAAGPAGSVSIPLGPVLMVVASGTDAATIQASCTGGSFTDDNLGNANIAAIKVV